MEERSKIIDELKFNSLVFSDYLNKYEILNSKLDEFIYYASKTSKLFDYHFSSMQATVNFIHGFTLALIYQGMNNDAFWFDELISKTYLSIMRTL